MTTIARFSGIFPARFVVALAAAGLATATASAQDAERLAQGKQIYQALCLSCHLSEGEGMPDLGVPLLVNADFLATDKPRLIRLLLYGLLGPITINGHTFNGYMTDMPAQVTFGLPDTTLDDRIANVLTYIMNSWGNRFGPVTADEVIAIRAQDSVYRIRQPHSPDEPPATFPSAPSNAAARATYITMCANCHREDGGKGLQRTIPPLAGADFLAADKDRAIRLLITGMRGPIVVNNRAYNSIMPLQVFTDQQIADLVNYELNAWGNNFGTVTTADVARVRKQN